MCSPWAAQLKLLFQEIKEKNINWTDEQIAKATREWVAYCIKIDGTHGDISEYHHRIGELSKRIWCGEGFD